MYCKKKFISLTRKVIGFFVYHYYSLMRNYYPFKLIGEKISVEKADRIIIFTRVGFINNIEISIKNLLGNPSLISCFHPSDAFKLGASSLEEIIFNLPKKDQMNKFNSIKKIISNSINNSFLRFYLEDNEYENNFVIENREDIANILINNKYLCKLVGIENKKNNDTLITFTVLGRRDGHEKLLSALVKDNSLIGKFHPSDALMFGFIYFGDIYFNVEKD